MYYQVSKQQGFILSLLYKVSRTNYCRIFEDKTVTEGSEYTYTVTGVVGTTEGMTSQGFTYTHNQQFCGNGQLDGYETLCLKL